MVNVIGNMGQSFLRPQGDYSVENWSIKSLVMVKHLCYYGGNTGGETMARSRPVMYTIRLNEQEHKIIKRAFGGSYGHSSLARRVLLAAAENILAAVGDVPDPREAELDEQAA
jgi:hypothetical protein